MENRYEKIVFEAEKGIIFEASEGTNGKWFFRARKIVANKVYSELPTVLAGEYAEVLSVYTDKDENKAVVPPGWTVSGEPNENIIWEKDKGLVIYHIPEKKVRDINWNNSDVVETLMRTYDQLVWTPTEWLTANATIDGIHFKERFGRMNYRKDKFSESGYHEPLNSEFLRQKESVDKYGGFYSSRYVISEDKETRKPRSIKGVYPLSPYTYLRGAKYIAKFMVETETITSHVMYGAEYDTREKWAIEVGTVTVKEIAEDSTYLGNYRGNNDYPYKMVKTGEDGCINNIYGFAGNVLEYTQEQYGDLNRSVIRGGFYRESGNDYPVSHRLYDTSFTGIGKESIGFRVALCIE